MMEYFMEMINLKKTFMWHAVSKNACTATWTAAQQTPSSDCSVDQAEKKRRMI